MYKYASYDQLLEINQEKKNKLPPVTKYVLSVLTNSLSKFRKDIFELSIQMEIIFIHFSVFHFE